MFKAKKRRVIRQPEKWIGKKVIALNIPEGFRRCAITGAIHPEDDLLISCPDYILSSDERKRVLWCEGADWLSERGWDLILQSWERNGIDLWERV